MNRNYYDFFSRIKSLISENELEIAIEQLLNFSKNEIPSFYLNEVLIHLSRIKQLRKDERLGLISRDDILKENTRIKLAVLDLVDDASTRFRNIRLPYTSQPIYFDLPEETNLEKIFGVNHLKKIAWLEKGLFVSKSICRVMTPTGFGSGFLLKDNYVLTNNHVIPTPNIARDTYIEFNYQEDINGKTLKFFTYSLNLKIFKTNLELDYTLVQVVETPEMPVISTWGKLELELNNLPSINDHVSIIQHPEGGPKQIALTANQVVNIYDHRLHYTTDTLPGSSGSPVFNDDWKVIAIHHAGGNLLMNNLGQKRFANEGILISFIIDDLNIDSSIY